MKKYWEQNFGARIVDWLGGGTGVIGKSQDEAWKRNCEAELGRTIGWNNRKIGGEN